MLYWFNYQFRKVFFSLKFYLLNSAMVANTFAIGSIISLCCFLGLVVYAKYFDCDPISAQVNIITIIMQDIYKNIAGTFIDHFKTGSNHSVLRYRHSRRISRSAWYFCGRSFQWSSEVYKCHYIIS